MKDVVENEAIRELNCKEKINTNVFTKNNGKGIIKNNNKLLLTKDIVLNKEMKKSIISKEHFKAYFNRRNIITKEEYERYLKIK